MKNEVGGGAKPLINNHNTLYWNVPSDNIFPNWLLTAVCTKPGNTEIIRFAACEVILDIFFHSLKVFFLYVFKVFKVVKVVPSLSDWCKLPSCVSSVSELVNHSSVTGWNKTLNYAEESKCLFLSVFVCFYVSPNWNKSNQVLRE